MKEAIMLCGFGIGLVAGALLYKYSHGAQKLVDKGENAVIKEIDKIENKMKKASKRQSAQN